MDEKRLTVGARQCPYLLFDKETARAKWDEYARTMHGPRVEVKVNVKTVWKRLKALFGGRS